MKYFRYRRLHVLMLLVLGLTGFVTNVEAAYTVSTDPMRVKQTYLDMIRSIKLGQRQEILVHLLW